MRCYACNRNLSDYESTLRSATTGEYLDTCNKCLKDLDIPTLKNNNSQEEPGGSDTDDSMYDFLDEEDDQ